MGNSMASFNFSLASRICSASPIAACRTAKSVFPLRLPVGHRLNLLLIEAIAAARQCGGAADAKALSRSRGEGVDPVLAYPVISPFVSPARVSALSLILMVGGFVGAKPG